MSVSKDTVRRGADPRANRLLRALPDAELDRIRPALEPVHLPRPTELEAANEEIPFVYFPTTASRPSLPSARAASRWIRR